MRPTPTTEKRAAKHGFPLIPAAASGSARLHAAHPLRDAPQRRETVPTRGAGAKSVLLWGRTVRGRFRGWRSSEVSRVSRFRVPEKASDEKGGGAPPSKSPADLARVPETGAPVGTPPAAPPPASPRRAPSGRRRSTSFASSTPRPPAPRAPATISPPAGTG